MSTPVEKTETQKKADALVKTGLKEFADKKALANGGQSSFDALVKLFAKVEETQYATKKLVVDETILGTIIDAKITNSVQFPDSYNIMLKCNNAYKHMADVPDGLMDQVDPSEFIIEQRREIVYVAKAGCTQILNAVYKCETPKVPYDLKTLSAAKVNPLAKIIGKAYSLKYLGLKKTPDGTHDFHSYVFQLF